MFARQRVVAPGGGQRLGATPALGAHGFVQRHAAMVAHQAGLVVFAGQQTKGERRIGQQIHAQAVAGFVQPVLIAAVDQAVRVLHRGHARQAHLFGHAHELVHAIGRLVGQADGAHLAGLDQFGHGFELRFDGGRRAVLGRVEVQGTEGRHVARRPVNLVEVDHLGLQAAQAALAGFDDAGLAHLGAQPGHATRRAGHLGGQHHLLPRARVAGEPVADDGFRRTAGFGLGRHGVHLGRVDEVHAAFERSVQHGVGVGLADLLAKGHGAQADGGDVQVGVVKGGRLHEMLCKEGQKNGTKGANGSKFRNGLCHDRVAHGSSRPAHV